MGMTQQTSLNSTAEALSNFSDFVTHQTEFNKNFLSDLRILTTPSQKAPPGRAHVSEGLPKAQLPNLHPNSQATVEEASSVKSNEACGHPKENLNHLTYKQEDPLNVAYQSHIQPLTARVTRVRHCRTRLIRLISWQGPLFVQHWHRDRRPEFGPLSRDQGYGMGVSVAFPRSRLKIATLTTCFIRRTNKSWISPSVHWNLSLPNVVAKDSEIMEFAFLGNLEAMVGLFRSGKAVPTDVTPDGNTLLHACSPGC
jgi:hypothetical protein